MANPENSNHAEVLRFLPSVDSVLQTQTAQQIAMKIGVKRLTALARCTVDALRQELPKRVLKRGDNYSKETVLAEAEKILSQIFQDQEK